MGVPRVEKRLLGMTLPMSLRINWRRRLMGMMSESSS